MTEDEWLNCTDPQRMLEWLRGRASERKLRLFAVACCYRIWHLLTDQTGRQAVEVAERIAEGEPSGVNLVDFVGFVQYSGFQYIDGFKRERDLSIASHAVYAAYHSLPDVFPPDAFHGFSNLRPNLSMVPVQAAWAGAHFHRRGDEDEADVEVLRQELKEQVPLLYDVFGPLPFRRAAFNPAWVVWHNSTVVRLAESIYENRAFDRLPVLADALQEGGCTDNTILDHCRDRGTHVRGCWVIDHLLGKD